MTYFIFHFDIRIVAEVNRGGGGDMVSRAIVVLCDPSGAPRRPPLDDDARRDPGGRSRAGVKRVH